MSLKKHSSPRFVIVLGTFYSGASAVYDFLDGRDDSCDPLHGNEYILPQIPYGIMSIHAVCENYFSHPSANMNLVNFKKIAYKLGDNNTKYSPGMGYANDIDNYYSLIDSFLDRIVVSSFSYEAHWDWFTAPLIKRIFNRVKRILVKTEAPKEKYLPTTETDFLEATHELHMRMFGNHKQKFTLLNQAGSGWNPVRSTDYFPDRKVILVVRDPRDQYCELKKYRNAGSVNEYIQWYREMRLRIASADSQLVKIVRFEEFVYEYSLISGDICEFLNIDKNILSNYDHVASRKNIGIYRELLGNDELEILSRELREYFYN